MNKPIAGFLKKKQGMKLSLVEVMIKFSGQRHSACVGISAPEEGKILKQNDWLHAYV